MDLQVFLLLAQDGISNGAIYVLLALALVLVFAVTRVTFVAQGEFVTYGALTLALLQAGKTPGTLWLVLVMGAIITVMDGVAMVRRGAWRRLLPLLAFNLGFPGVCAALLFAMPWAEMPMLAQALMTLALVVPLGPMLYRLVFQPLEAKSTLVKLIASVAVHMALGGLGLLFFGAEGFRTTPFTEASFDVADIPVQGQNIVVVASSLLLILALYFFFDHTIRGKALRATAMNRTGARLMGISPALAGQLSFLLASAIGAFSGILIAPITTIYYDSGFLIGLKGFVGAIIGALASYPVAALGALAVGLLESYSSFWASAYKEVIVFTLIIPVLLWRSLTTRDAHEEEDE
ncbi:MAG: branched-chain amino acid ABC transporter permease [Brachymonas sp.]|nr:branched-chain amino acid ABC transporter permease [Brachymonas sp.]